MAQYIAKEIKCATANIGAKDVVGLAETNKYCAFGRNNSSNRFISFIKHDLGDIKDIEIKNAYLYIYVCGGGYVDYATYNVYNLESEWNEDTVCGNLQPSRSTNRVDFKLSTTNKWAKIDITQLVKDWIENESAYYGISIYGGDSGSNGTYAYIRNRHYTDDPTLASYIEINYVGQQMYKISEARLRKFGDEIRRITGTTDSLTVEEMLTKLESIPAQTT